MVEEFDEVGTDLDDVLERWQGESDGIEAQLAENEHEAGRLKQRGLELAAAVSKETEQRGALAARADYGKKAEAEFSEKLAEIRGKYDMFSSSIASSSSASVSAGDDSLSQLADEVERRSQACGDVEKSQSAERAALQREVTDYKIKLKSAQKEVLDRTAECTQCSKDKQRLVLEATAVGDARSLQRNLNNAKSAVATASADAESGASIAVVRSGRDRIEAIKKELHQLKDEVDDLTDERKKREAERSGWASLDQKRKELQERDDETERSFDRIRSTLNGLFNDDIPVRTCENRDVLLLLVPLAFRANPPHSLTRSPVHVLLLAPSKPLDSLEMRVMALCDERADVRERRRVEKEKKQERYTTAEEKSKASQREYAHAVRSAQHLIDTSLLEMAQRVSEANADETRSAAAAGDADDGQAAAAAAAALDDSTASAAGSASEPLIAGSEVHVALLKSVDGTLAKIAARVTELNADIAGAKQVRSALKRLLKASKANQECMCCLRVMDAVQVNVLSTQMKMLMERQSAAANEEKRETIKALEKKRREISAHLDDWRKWKTLSMSTGSGSVVYAKAAHEKLKQRANEKKIELDEAKQALEMATMEHDHAQQQYTDVVVIANKHRSAKQARLELEDLEESQVCVLGFVLPELARVFCRGALRSSPGSLPRISPPDLSPGSLPSPPPPPALSLLCLRSASRDPARAPWHRSTTSSTRLKRRGVSKSSSSLNAKRGARKSRARKSASLRPKRNSPRRRQQ